MSKYSVKSWMFIFDPLTQSTLVTTTKHQRVRGEDFQGKILIADRDVLSITTQDCILLPSIFGNRLRPNSKHV